MAQTDTNLGIEAPNSRVHQAPVANATIAADLNTNIHRVVADGTVGSVTYIPKAAITGADTDYRSVALVNLGAAGAGTAVIATYAFTSGHNAAAGVEKAIPLSGTAANLLVSAGDILQWQSTHTGAGLVDPGGLVVVTIGRT